MTTLREAAQQALTMIEATLGNLTAAKEQGLITGTIWFSWDGTLFDYLASEAEALRAALAEQPAEQEPKTQGWQPIETAPKGRVLLVYYKNSLGNGRTMRARHYLPETLESDTTESGWADEGWYEESEAYEYLMPLEHDPTHWMPLPAGPDTAPQPAKRVQLTDEEVLKIWSPEPSRPVMGKNKVLTFARAIERAHGIGEQE